MSDNTNVKHMAFNDCLSDEKEACVVIFALK